MDTVQRRNRGSFPGVALVLIATGALIGCRQTSDADEVGVVRVAVTVVPTDVRCIRIAVMGNRDVSRNFSVTPGASTVMELSGLPAGEVEFSADAFASTCGNVGPSSVPIWSSDPVVVRIVSGVTADVGLVMRRTGRASVSVDFQEGMPDTCSGTCTALPNTTATCQNNQCVRGCAAGTTPLSCSTSTAPVCGRWGFESASSEGWSAIISGLTNPPDGLGWDRRPLRVSPLHASAGSQSLAVGFDFNLGQNLLLRAPLCPTGINLNGKRLRAHFFIESSSGGPLPGLFSSISTTTGVPGGAVRVASHDGTEQDFFLEGTVSSTQLMTSLEIFVVVGGQPFTGTIYLDDMRID